MLAVVTVTAIAGDVNIRYGIKIPTRDGIRLSATVYLPKESKSSPTILSITPYTTDTMHARGMYFAQHGFSFVVLDVRGRGNSEGSFEPFVRDGRDGYDAVEWLAKQDWSNGRIGMFGLSYGGFAQWAVAKENPPHLVTIAPSGAVYPGVDFPHYKNIPNLTALVWAASTAGRVRNTNLGGDDTYWFGKFSEAMTAGVSYGKMDAFCGFELDNWRKWNEHPTQDSFWQATTAYGKDFSRIKIPVLTITGQYDDDQPGAMTYYRNHLQNGGNDCLVIGPWDHVAVHGQTVEYEGLHFGKEAKLDIDALHLAWYQWTMMDGEKPTQFRNGNVYYYSIGNNVWKNAKTLPGQTGTKIYLGHEQRLVSSPATGPIAQFSYNPRFEKAEAEILDNHKSDRMVGTGKHILYVGTGGLIPNAGVTFMTEPLTSTMEMAGNIKVSLNLVINTNDADMYACVFEIRPDGKFIQLTSDAVRLRYRDGLDKARVVVPGQAFQVELNGFNFIAKQFPVGTRFALAICPLKSLLAQRNNGSSVDPMQQSDLSLPLIEVRILGGEDTYMVLPK